ncbi:MAG: DUF2892 domain-containing protein [Bacteroidales bacterium]|jgi:hypothetical protein|nr:DUF2892 domain-containing protein [Bacteroidales bacterium]NCU36789.1 DUF2892 domain-containing protein [Candidatus Falkowbacteria bacterium]MDD2631765.1 DUF2892 domain-containing protein [Bacteroidales bacterium]MDD3131515.1 DUF2892 domain-containing protein [Bacteroidales bacterium]MDD4176959.1 DUF2892 domain-containing protein [Bacteroidales bacterium]
MKRNMGIADRVLRIIIAIVIGALYFTGYLYDWWGIVLLVLAIIFVITSFVGFCPAYRILGIKTRARNPEKQPFG